MTEDVGAIAAGHSAEERTIAETQETAEVAESVAIGAEAQAEMAGEAAETANQTAEAAAGIAVVGATTAIDAADNAAVQAEEAKQEAGIARSETAELREWLGGQFKQLEDRLFPPEPEVPESGVKEITLDESDVGGSGNPEGNKPGNGSGTVVQPESAEGESETGNTSTAASRRFRHRRRG